jgi:hypothetical protein
VSESAGGKKDEKTANKQIWLALGARDKGQGRKEEGNERNEGKRRRVRCEALCVCARPSVCER